MQLFELKEKDVQFTHMNTRTEKHGEDDVLAVDLDMMVSTCNDDLAMLSPTLCWSLYDKPDGKHADLATQGQTDQFVRLRYPQLGPLRWDLELHNCRVTFHYGLDPKRDIVLFVCKVGKFRVQCHDGGTIELGWRVQTNPTHEQIGRLSERLAMGTVSVSIERSDEAPAQPPVTNQPEPNPVEKRAAAAASDDDSEDDLMPASRAPAGRRRRSTANVE